MEGIRVLVWNVEWARPRTPRGREIRRQIQEVDPDLICVTEGFAALLPDSGHVIDSDLDYGYQIREGRRKVLLWNREPWEEVDRVGHQDLPGGRYAGGVTATPAGSIQIFGVCIPWRDAHVRTGRRDRSAWEDHRSYLRGLQSLLRDPRRADSALVIGDFNQRIPRSRTPKAVHRELLDTFEEGFRICTAGEVEGADGRAIDHVAHTPNLRSETISVLPKRTEAGLRLSDHFGLVVELRNGVPSRGG